MAMNKAKIEEIDAQMDDVDNKIIIILCNGETLETGDIANRLGISIDEAEKRLNKIKNLGLVEND